MRFAVFLLGAFWMIPAPPSSATPGLDQLRNRARPLLLFAPEASDPALEAQLRILQEGNADSEDRDLVPVALSLRGSSVTQMSFSSAEASALRRRFHIPDAGFTALLLGKDGGEKLRSSQPFSMKTLNETIDAMPMRQDEMRAHPSRSH